MKVIWDKQALADLHNLLVYCRTKFGKRVANKCKKEWFDKASILETFPCAGLREPLLADEPEDFRSLVLHPHLKLIYCVDESKGVIHIFRLWDTRRDPASLAALTSHLSPRY